MPHSLKISRLTPSFVILTFLVGCGTSRQQSAISSTSITSITSPASPTPTASSSYDASLFDLLNQAGTEGQVSVDSTGKVIVQLTTAIANTAFAVQFCPAPAQNYTCFRVGAVSTDSSGNANTTMRFPQSGSWAGDFQLLVNGSVQYATDIPVGANPGVYSATLQPRATANRMGNFLSVPVPSQGPLTGGTMTLINGSMQVKLTGALPNTSYSAGQCPLFLAQVATHCMTVTTKQF
jgi:hypothetical protein